jgi:hypothetical protein
VTAGRPSLDGDPEVVTARRGGNDVPAPERQSPPLAGRARLEGDGEQLDGTGRAGTVGADEPVQTRGPGKRSGWLSVVARHEVVQVGTVVVAPSPSVGGRRCTAPVGGDAELTRDVLVGG